jgi:hypothetical protein
MNVYRRGNVLDVRTFRPRFAFRRRSSRLEVQDECHADPYCPDFIASGHSQLGWLTMHPTRIAQNAAGIMRPAAEIAPCLDQQPVHAISLNLKRPDRRLRRADNVWPRATSCRQGANDVRHHQLHVVEPRNRGNNSEPPALAAYSSERKDPDRSNSDLLRCNRKCASGDLASVATNCEHRRSAGA